MEHTEPHVDAWHAPASTYLDGDTARLNDIKVVTLVALVHDHPSLGDSLGLHVQNKLHRVGVVLL